MHFDSHFAMCCLVVCRTRFQETPHLLRSLRGPGKVNHIGNVETLRSNQVELAGLKTLEAHNGSCTHASNLDVKSAHCFALPAPETLSTQW